MRNHAIGFALACLTATGAAACDPGERNPQPESWDRNQQMNDGPHSRGPGGADWNDGGDSDGGDGGSRK